MGRREIRHIYAKELLADIKDSAPIQAIGVAIAAAGGFGVFALFDVSGGHAWIFGVGMVIVWEAFVVYSVVSRTSDRLEELLNREGDFRVLAGPTHARLRNRGDLWRSDPVSLSIIAEVGSAVDLRLAVPAAVELVWVNVAYHPVLWKLLGPDEEGNKTFEASMPHVREFITSLGQFIVKTNTFIAATPQVTVTATKIGADGSGSKTETAVGAVFDVSDETFGTAE